MLLPTLLLLLAADAPRAQFVVGQSGPAGAGVLALPVPQQGVVLNEILYAALPLSADPAKDHEWVELVNRGPLAADLSGWVLTDRDGPGGAAAFELPALLLPPDALLVVHFAAGTDDLDVADGCAQLYTGAAPGADVLADDGDECAVYAGGRIRDFIAWHAGADGYLPGLAAVDAVADGSWTAGAFLDSSFISNAEFEKVRSVQTGSSIGRDRHSTDTDTPADWESDGGADALGATPCAPNASDMFLALEEEPPADFAGVRAWTLMFYMDGDDATLEKYTFRDALELARAGGSNADVNVVAMFDGLGSVLQVTLAAGLIPIPDFSTRGGTWRFSVGGLGGLFGNVVLMRSPAGQNPFLGAPAAATPDRNMGDPAELSGFIAWAQANFPAQRYALFLGDHGDGWKGCCSDATSPGVIHPAEHDLLTMGELRQALAGQDLDLLVFDECMMGQLEVAWQVRDRARFILASEEVEQADGYPNDVWLPALKANADAWTGRELGQRMLADFHAYYSDPGTLFTASTAFPRHTVALYESARLAPLADAVSAMADELAAACDDFVTHDNAADNVLALLAVQAAATSRFTDRNYMDLRHFASLVSADGQIPACHKDLLAAVSSAVGPGAAAPAAVIAEAHGPAWDPGGAAAVFGMSIAMPLGRALGLGAGSAYDFPNARATDADSLQTIYAPNPDPIPTQANDVETGVALAAPMDFPRLAQPQFLFPVDHRWDEFLYRFYKPVADARIVMGVGAGGELFMPVVNDPACGNPVDVIDVVPGSTVTFSSTGSSDVDSFGGALSMAYRSWDFDAGTAAFTPEACVAPWQVVAGLDPITANDDMNADVDADKAPTDDERQALGVAVARTFSKAGEYTVTLHVWDDHQLFAYADTTPNAQHMHLQSDSHTCIVRVAECFLLLGLEPASLPLPGHPLDTLLVVPLLKLPVTVETLPVWNIPADPGLSGLHLYAQIYLNNPPQFPDDPVQLSNALDLTLGVGSASYGSGSGMTLWAQQPPLLGGVLKLAFVINGS